jgi:hypothetical protein
MNLIKIVDLHKNTARAAKQKTSLEKLQIYFAPTFFK